MVIAGFTATEADQLRRAMSRSRSHEAMAALRGRFLRGAQANGVDEATAEEVFRQLEGFAGFGFCKSHAASFALVAYQTLYLKAHFPVSYFCALLNHQPMGFYPPEVIIGDARHHGVPILPPDVNPSAEACTLEEAAAFPTGHSMLALRLGLRYVHGLGEAWQARIVERRDSKPFQNLSDFCRRTRLPRPIVENLIRAGAMESLAHKRSNPRRNLLWELGGVFYQEDGLDIEMPVEPVALPVLGEAERMGWEYELLGLAPGGHLMDLYRPALQRQGVSTSRDLEALRDGALVRLAGYAVVRQRPPTAKGFLFITLEDEEGLANLIVRPQVYEQYRGALRNAARLGVEGQLQREGHAFSVLVHRAAALGPPW
jgi:error-prone DNA polymerase